MKLSTRTRYGIRAVLDLAENYGHGPMQLKVIAKRQEISAKYLEQLMTMLRSAGIVNSVRGSKGGYVLTRPPNDIKLSECFNCLEGPVITVECVRNEDYCKKTHDCASKEIWTKVRNAVMNVLQSMTLQDIIDKEKNNHALHYQI